MSISVSAGHYLYVRHTDTEGKRSSVFDYRVWNSEVAIKHLNESAERENAKARKEDRPARAKIEVIDQPTFNAERAR